MPAPPNSQATRTAMAAVGGDLPRRVTVASATPATARDRQRRLSLELSGFTRGGAGCRDVAGRIGTDRSDLPLAVPGRRPHPADLAGGAGIVGQLLVADDGSLGNGAVGKTPEVRAPGPLDLFSDRSGTFSS